jgi:hypothetical protein
MPRGKPSPKLAIRNGLAGVAEYERAYDAFTDQELAEARQRVAEELATLAIYYGTP